jgi:hypothetical protein
MALELSEDDIGAALFDLITVLKGFDHIPVGRRVFQVHIERRRKGSADPVKSSFTAPELYAALVVDVKLSPIWPRPSPPGDL